MIFVISLFLFYRNGSWKQPYDKYDIAHNTGTIPVVQRKPYSKYDIAQNTGTIPVE
jgi:hypothetical protein